MEEIFLNVKNNNLVEVKKYLRYGDINIVDENNKSLLHHAVSNGAFDCVNVLVENYIDLNLKDKDGQTAMFTAAMKGQLGMVKILFRNKCNPNLIDNYGNIPLFYAIKINSFSIVDILINDTDLKIRNKKGEDALFIAIKYGYKGFEQFIIDDNINNYNYKKESVLHYAAKTNNLAFLSKYTNRLNINFMNNNKESVFYYACKYSNREVIRYLLQFLPCLDITNRFSETLLEEVKNNNNDIYDLIDIYSTSLSYLHYKQNNRHIYQYLTTNYINDNISKPLQNKKDNFELSLIDYLLYNNDINNLKLLGIKYKNNC